LDYEGNRQNAQRFVNTPNFAQFTGNFGVPLTENIGSGRLDWVLNNKLNGFYRFQHDDNVAVTGFGGISLSAFSNLNNTNYTLPAPTIVAGTGSMASALLMSILITSSWTLTVARARRKRLTRAGSRSWCASATR